MRFLRTMIDKFLDLFSPKTATLNKQVADAIDLRDLFAEDLHMNRQEMEALADNFKMFSSKDDYNKEFLHVFQTCKASFYLDHTHRDGHFRV
jgi:hypothetical protein